MAGGIAAGGIVPLLGRWLVLLLAALGALALTGCGEGDGDLPVLRVGLPNKAGNRALLEAANELKDLPYRIEWSEFNATPALLEAMRSGAVDLGQGGSTALILESGNAASGKLRVIAASNKIKIEKGKTKILLLRTGQAKQGVIGLYQPNLQGEQGKGGLERRQHEALFACGRQFRRTQADRKERGAQDIDDPSDCVARGEAVIAIFGMASLRVAPFLASDAQMIAYLCKVILRRGIGAFRYIRRRLLHDR
ncbi:hypothetical protein U8326_06435 [Tsuneonella sp. CC-YZS046]|uniref:hypothetical protein n=1 Tax=Tsuneonella sp. CC-YZS046 TaxID=3042152 RepID=UPI002D79C760|nr:hypothetical protein [Tsuneonella sp. CC-YZS046]WRO67789.1 hypothetical protein U8326_06435 [Tsuneonella sp. CC-YZS046]